MQVSGQNRVLLTFGGKAQLLDFFFKAAEYKGRSAILQQYQSKSPDFHDKKGDEHIRRMIAESLGDFMFFESSLPPNLRRQLQRVYDDLGLGLIYPVVYPALQDLRIEANLAFVSRYKLFKDVDSQGTLFLDEEVPCSLV